MVSAVSALPGMTVSGPWTRSRFSGRSGSVRRPWRPLWRPWGPSWRPWTTLLRRWWGLGEFLHNSFWWKSFVCPLIHSFKKDSQKSNWLEIKKRNKNSLRSRKNIILALKVAYLKTFYTLAQSSILTIFSLEGNSQDIFEDEKTFWVLCSKFLSAQILFLEF